MNKNQKQIIKTFYDAYLAGEDSLRKAIKERIDVLEKDTNWQRELKDGTTSIETGYISSKNVLFVGSYKTISFDDDEIYYMFLTTLFNNKFNINGQVYTRIKEALLKASLKYFGKTSATLKERAESYEMNKGNKNKLSKFKNKQRAYCSEKALFVQNIMSLLGIKSYIIHNLVKDSIDKEWGLHAYNIIKYNSQYRVMDISYGRKYTYYCDECINEEVWEAYMYSNDIHRIASNQRMKSKIWDVYIDIEGNIEFKPRVITYGNVGSKEKIFRRTLRTRVIDKEIDNDFLNKVIGGKRNLMKEKETYSANTAMAYRIIPLNIVDDREQYCKLKTLAYNEGDIQSYINEIYLKWVKPDTRKTSKIQQFAIEYVVKDVSYMGKSTKMLVLKLPIANEQIYKFETFYSAIVFDEEFSRIFNLTRGYPAEKRESKDFVLHEILNTMVYPIHTLNGNDMEPFVDCVIQQINKEESITIGEIVEYIDKHFDEQCDPKSYKLALDIYNKGLMKSDFNSNRMIVKYYTKIPCDKCYLYCAEIEEFPEAYNAKEYMGYTNMAGRNFNCEFVKHNMVCPFRLLSFVERLVLNTNISPKSVLTELIKIQTKRERINGKYTFKSK